MSIKPIDVRILERTFSINCPQEHEQALLNTADDLNVRLAELASRSKFKGSDQLLSITALNLCHEYRQLKIENEQLKAQVANKITELDDLLKKTLSIDSE